MDTTIHQRNQASSGQFLNGLLSDYFMVLGVITCERNDEEIPVIIIVHGEENEEELPRLAQFPA